MLFSSLNSATSLFASDKRPLSSTTFFLSRSIRTCCAELSREKEVEPPPFPPRPVDEREGERFEQAASIDEKSGQRRHEARRGEEAAAK